MGTEVAARVKNARIGEGDHFRNGKKRETAHPRGYA